MEALNSSVSCRDSDSTAPFMVLYILAFLVGLLGTLSALWGFTCNCGTRRSIDVYLLNLLVSDLLLTLALPFKIAVIQGAAPWSLQIFHCQATAVVIYINLYASIVFLALISVDRYLQISQSPRLTLCPRGGSGPGAVGGGVGTGALHYGAQHGHPHQERSGVTAAEVRRPEGGGRPALAQAGHLPGYRHLPERLGRRTGRQRAGSEA
ncbi:hypothetical protein GJAV_G00123200, partial [Gymnothorax javanicus]